MKLETLVNSILLLLYSLCTYSFYEDGNHDAMFMCVNVIFYITLIWIYEYDQYKKDEQIQKLENTVAEYEYQASLREGRR